MAQTHSQQQLRITCLCTTAQVGDVLLALHKLGVSSPRVGVLGSDSATEAESVAFRESQAKVKVAETPAHKHETHKPNGAAESSQHQGRRYGVRVRAKKLGEKGDLSAIVFNEVSTKIGQLKANGYPGARGGEIDKFLKGKKLLSAHGNGWAWLEQFVRKGLLVKWRGHDGLNLYDLSKEGAKEGALPAPASANAPAKVEAERLPDDMPESRLIQRGAYFQEVSGVK